MTVAVAPSWRPTLRRHALPRQRSGAGPCAACEAGLEPFTVPHFERWCRDLRTEDAQPLILEAFQTDFAADLFSGYAVAWLVLPEGQGKTTLVAALALHHLEHRASAYIPIAASSRDQAGVFYKQAAGFVSRSPRLRAVFRPLRGYRHIRLVGHESEQVEIQIYAADAGTGDGVIPTLAIIDELHRHKDLELYELWTGKLEKRRGQLVVMSTAGEVGSPFEEKRAELKTDPDEIRREGAFTRAVSSGIAIHDWALPEGADPEDMAAVKAANPSGRITVDTLTRKRRATTLEHWLRMTGNRATRSVVAAVSRPEWDAARTQETIPIGEAVALGLDVGWKLDTTAMVPLWTPHQRKRILGPATVLWPPEDGSMLSSSAIQTAVLAIHDSNPIVRCVMDPTRAAQLAEWMRGLGIEVIERQPTNPNAAEDYERFMEGLREGWLFHQGDQALTEHVHNAVTATVGPGRVKFERPALSRRDPRKQRRRVIDALDAAAMVHSVYAEQPDDGEIWVASV